MTKWNLQKDVFLVRTHGAVNADYVAMHDLGFKSLGAGEKRVKLLKETGVWDKIQAYLDAKTVMECWHTLAFSRHAEAMDIALNELEDGGFDVPEFVKVEEDAA